MGLMTSVCQPSTLRMVDLYRRRATPRTTLGGVCGRQHGLGLDPSFELLVQSLDCIRCACTALLGRWQTGEGEELVDGFLQAVGHGAVLEPPLADESLAARVDFLRRGTVDHIVVVGSDLIAQALRRMRQPLPLLADRAALHR